MPLDPQIEKILKDEQAAAVAPPASGPVVADVRRQLETRTASFRSRYTPPQDCGTRDLFIDDLPCRLYFPHAADDKPPLLVFFHGGGFVAGSVDTHDGLVRELCVGAKYAVLSVGYRLAPENKFPAAVNDGMTALRWAEANAAALGCDSSRIMIGGDSAGANIAAVTALRVRDEGIGEAVFGQLLIYPVTDHYSAGHASYATYATNHGLTRASMVWYWNQYLGDAAEAANSWVSPLRTSSLAHLSPACVVTTECDILRDEGQRYAEKLRDHGVDTVAFTCTGMNHGFLRFVGVVDRVRPIISEITLWMRQHADQAKRERSSIGVSPTVAGLAGRVPSPAVLLK